MDDSADQYQTQAFAPAYSTFDSFDPMKVSSHLNLSLFDFNFNCLLSSALTKQSVALKPSKNPDGPLQPQVLTQLLLMLILLQTATLAALSIITATGQAQLSTIPPPPPLCTTLITCPA